MTAISLTDCISGGAPLTQTSLFDGYVLRQNNILHPPVTREFGDVFEPEAGRAK